MMSTQSDLDERFRLNRYHGTPEVQELIRAWDAVTNLTPLEAIEMAEGEDLKERVSDLEKEVDKLEDHDGNLQAALDNLRWHIFGGAKRFSHEFSDDYFFQQGDTARRDVREVAPDIADDVQCAYILVEDGEIAEVWTSPSFSSHVAFSRVY